MKSQFNLFCFEVQITKPERYRVQIFPDGCIGDQVPHTTYTATFLGAVLQGWRHARMLAEVERKGQSVVIHRLPDHFLGSEKRVFVGTICIKIRSKYFFQLIQFK